MDLVKYKTYFGKIHFSELFPTKWSAFIFVAYMAFFVNQGLLVTASQKTDNSYDYNIIVAVLSTEVIKLVVSLVLYSNDNNFLNIVKDSKSHLKAQALVTIRLEDMNPTISSTLNETKAYVENSKTLYEQLCVLQHYHLMMGQYFVPAFLYCLYNNLAFVNLSVFDPTTYYLLLQLRVVVTGVLFQIIFNKKLSSKQWLSLVFLTVGCMVKHVPFPDSAVDNVTPPTDTDVLIKTIDKGTTPIFSLNMLLILIQVVCSCLAGVYNELLLKGPNTESCNIYLQNVFMYLDSIICNVTLLIWQGEIQVLWDIPALKQMLHLKVLLVILNNAAIGIVTSFFLRSLNSVLKTFASALELIFTAILTWMLFGIPIYLNTLFAILIVSLAVIMYSQNPVTNVRPSKDVSQGFSLV